FYFSHLISYSVKKIIELTDQLKATNGGTAKFQIQDTNLGKINLQIDMKDKNSITIFIQTEHTDVKKNIEDKIDSLKQSLNSQKIELTDFKVTILDKPLSSQSQFNNSGQQDQNSQSFNQNAFFQHNFKQNTGHKGNDGNEHNNTMSLNDNKKYKNMQKNSITNIQRGANGSIHVSA
ncbi:MAG: flagellar hook-length control protein FliK, partial [Bdellovibrionota bacterium]